LDQTQDVQHYILHLATRGKQNDPKLILINDYVQCVLLKK